MLDSCCISKRLSRVYKGQTGFKFRGLRFRVFGVFVFEFLGASFSRFGCFVLRSSFSSASFSKLPIVGSNLNPASVTHRVTYDHNSALIGYY